MSGAGWPGIQDCRFFVSRYVCSVFSDPLPAPVFPSEVIWGPLKRKAEERPRPSMSNLIKTDAEECGDSKSNPKVNLVISI